MEKYLRIKWSRILSWLMILIVLAFGLWILDIRCLQPHAVIFLVNYSDIILVIWQIQATIASLTLASAAFILSRIDDSYYGISVKNLLHISRFIHSKGLTFWEMLICSIASPAITWIFVILNNIISVTFLFLFTVFLTVSILLECINVITRAELYSSWAKGFVDQLVEIITASDKTKEQEAARNQFHEIVSGIKIEVSSQIKSGVDLHESNTFWYFVNLIDKFSTDNLQYINEQMHSVLIDWLRLTIDEKSEKNIHAVLYATYPKDTHSKWSATGIDVFMYSYYRGEMSQLCFQSEIDRICMDILQAYDDYSAKALFVLHNAIFNADINTFVAIMKSVWRSHPHNLPKQKANVLVTAFAYLYYVTFKERYILIEKGPQFLEKLRAFSSASILDSFRGNKPLTIADILSDTDMIFEGVEFLLDYFDSRAFNWEYIPLGKAKTVHLDSDTIEFLTFYCHLFCKNIVEDDLKPFKLSVLLKMRSYLNVNGMIADKCRGQYTDFCNWLGKGAECERCNIQFSTALLVEIKVKMFEEAKDIRQKEDIWKNKIDNMRDEIKKCLSKSVVYAGEHTTGESINLRYCDFHMLKDFSDHVGLYGYDRCIQVTIDGMLFDKLRQHNMLDSCPINNSFNNLETNLELFEKMLASMEEDGVTIDQSYNLDFFNFFTRRQLPPHISDKIQHYNQSIQKHADWDTRYAGVAIYVDSSKMNARFYVPQDSFMSIVEELTTEELLHLCKNYLTPEGYIFKEGASDIGIPFSKEELIEYLRIVMIKIRYVCPAVLPRQKAGFFTYIVNRK